MANNILPRIGNFLLNPLLGTSTFDNPVGQIQDTVNAFTHPIQTAEDQLPPIGATLGGIGVGALGLPSGPLDVGLSAGGAMAGYNAGEWAKNKLQGQPYQPLSPGNLVGTGLSGVMEGGGKILSGAVTNAAKNIAAKNAQAPLNEFKTIPSDIVNFKQDFGSGTGLLDYINKFKQQGWDGLSKTFNDQVLQPLYKRYNDLLGAGNVRVNRQELINAYDDRINYEKAMNPADKTGGQTAQALEAEKNNHIQYLDNAANGTIYNKGTQESPAASGILDKNGNVISSTKTDGTTQSPSDYDARVVNARKSFVDKSTPNAQFNLSPQQATNVKRISGDILRQSVYDASDQAGDPAVSGALKTIGIDAKAANKINEMAEDTNALKESGKYNPQTGGNKLPTVGLLGRGTIEAGVGALLSHLLGIPPEIGGLAAPAITETAIAHSDPLISGASAVLNNPIGKNVLRGVGQVGANAANNLLGQYFKQPGNANSYNAGNNNAHPSNSSTYPLQLQVPPPSAALNGIDVTKNYNPQGAQWNVPDVSSMPLPKDIPPNLVTAPEVLKATLNDLGNKDYYLAAGAKSDQLLASYLANKGINQDTIDFVNGYTQHTNDLNALARVIDKWGTGWMNNVKLIQQIKAYNDPDFGVALSMLPNLNLTNIREVQGRPPSRFEQGGGASIFPSATDSTQTAIAKLNQIQVDNQQEYARVAPYVNLQNLYNTQESLGNNPSPSGNMSLPSIAPTPTRQPERSDVWNGQQWITQ